MVAKAEKKGTASHKGNPNMYIELLVTTQHLSADEKSTAWRWPVARSASTDPSLARISRKTGTFAPSS